MSTSSRRNKGFNTTELPHLQVFVGETREVLDQNVEIGDRVGHQRQMAEYHEHVNRKTAIVGKNFLQVLVHYGLRDGA